MQPRIRAARKRDAKAMGVLKLRASLAWGDHLEQIRALPDASRFPPEHLRFAIVAEMEGAILGFATVLPGPEGSAELEDLFVDPDNWGHGVGRLLAAGAEGRAKDLDADRLLVVAGLRAHGFYKACGFRILGVAETQFEPAFRMEKRLGRR